MCEKTAAAYIDRSSSWLRNARYEDRERMARDEPPRGPQYIRQGSAIRYTIEDLDAWVDQFKAGDVPGWNRREVNTLGLRNQS
jgi:hypothetical protein